MCVGQFGLPQYPQVRPELEAGHVRLGQAPTRAAGSLGNSTVRLQLLKLVSARARAEGSFELWVFLKLAILKEFF